MTNNLAINIFQANVMISCKFVLLLVILVATKGAQSENAFFVCPGTKTSFSCSVELPISFFQWRIWCDVSGGEGSETCQDTCTSSLPSDIILNTGSEIRSGTLCSNSDNSEITYELTARRDEILVRYSVLSLSIPIEFHQQRLCFRCLSQSPKYLLILGPPSTPSNFTSSPDYTTATDVDVEIFFRWSESVYDDTNVSVVYEVTISEERESTSTTTAYTSTASLTARLQFNTTYLLTVYALICNDTLISDPLMKNITVYMEVWNSTTEETTVKDEEKLTTAKATDEEASVSMSAVYMIVIAVLTVSCVVFNFITFALGVLVGVRMKTKTKIISIPDSSAQSEAAISVSAAGVELERAHEYEDIVLQKTPEIDTFTSNVAYGCN